MSVKIDPEGPRRSKKNLVRLRKLRQTSQAAFAASSFSSWFAIYYIVIQLKFIIDPLFSVSYNFEQLLNNEHCRGTFIIQSLI